MLGNPSSWLALFASAWLLVSAVTGTTAHYVTVHAAELYNQTAAAEASFADFTVRVNLDFAPDMNTTDERRAEYSRYVAAHEQGHLVCWQTARDASETCADAYAERAGFPAPR